MTKDRTAPGQFYGHISALLNIHYFRTVNRQLPQALIFLLFFALKAKAQPDTLFRHDPDTRLVMLHRITVVRYFNNPDSAFAARSLDTIARLAEKHNDDRLKWYAAFNNQLAYVYRRQTGEPQLLAFRHIKPWVDNCPLEVIRGAYMHLYGSALFYGGLHAEAIEQQLQAYRIFNKVGLENIPEAFSYLQGMAFMYYFFEDYPRTLQLLQESAKNHYHSPAGLINNYNTQGMAHQKMRNYEAAKEQFKKAIEVARSHGDSVWTGIACGNYGYTLSLQGRYQEAIVWLERDFNNNRTIELQNTAITSVYLAQAKLRTGDIERAGKYLDTGRILEGGTNDPVFYTHYYKVRAEYYESIDDYRRANAYLDSSIRLKDSLKIIFNTQLMTNADRRLQAEKFMTELDKAANEKKASQLTRNLVIAGSLVVIAFISLLLVWRNRTFRQKLQHAELQLNDYVSSLTEKNELIVKIREELNTIQQPGHSEKLQYLNELLQFSLLTDNDWNRFKILFEKVHPFFFASLKEKFPDLTPAETRLLALSKLNLSPREMSAMLGISPDSITKLKYRLRKKMTTTDQQNDLEMLMKEP
jgi:tetratricopeptide (TPR) repeat protein